MTIYILQIKAAPHTGWIVPGQLGPDGKLRCYVDAAEAERVRQAADRIYHRARIVAVHCCKQCNVELRWAADWCVSCKMDRGFRDDPRA